MSRKISLLVIVMLLMTLVVPTSIFAQEELKVKVNGESISFTAPLFTENGRTLVPLESLFEKLGAKVTRDQNTLWVKDTYTSVELTLGQKTANIHKNYDFSGIPQKVELDVAPRTVGNTVFVPLRFIVEALGHTVAWDEKNDTVVIKSDSMTTPVEAPASYKAITKEAIQNNKDLNQWYEENYKTAGIHFKTAGSETYVLVGAGEKPTGGYGIEIESSTLVAPGSVYITAKVKAPSPDMMVTQAITYPHVLLQLEAKDVKKVDGIVATDTNTSSEKTITDIGAAISPADVKSIELFSLTQVKLKDYNEQEIQKIVGYYNTGSISDTPMILMLAGNAMVITLKDGNKINFTSYGSQTNLVANREIKGVQTTHHLICPEIAKMLLEK